MLFDGTPELTNSQVIYDLIEYPGITEIYQIWFDRNSLDRIKSLVRKYKRLSDEIRATLPKFIDDMDSQLEKAKSILGDNVFVSKINAPNVERKIEKFLGITETTLCFPWVKN